MKQQVIYLDDELARQWAIAVPARLRSEIARSLIRAYLRQMDTTGATEGLAIFKEAVSGGANLTIGVKKESTP